MSLVYDVMLLKQAAATMGTVAEELITLNNEAVKNSTIFSYIGQYVDLDYSIWLYRLLTPLLLTFILPALFVLLIYFSISICYVFKLHR